MFVVTASQYIQSTVGLSGIVTYLALYIGLVLFIACAVILALQQLSEASDNAHVPTKSWRKLGAEKGLTSRALFVRMACTSCSTAYGSCARNMRNIYYGFCHPSRLAALM